MHHSGPCSAKVPQPPVFGWFTDRHFQALAPTAPPNKWISPQQPSAADPQPGALAAANTPHPFLDPCVTGSDEFGDAPFFTEPSISELRQMSTSQLQAVDRFTIGRVGLGYLVCERPVDLSSVDLPALVRQVTVERGAVAVHGVMQQQSFRGVLQDVFPEFGGTVPAFERKLRRRIERAGQLLVSYDSTGGVVQILVPPRRAVEEQWGCGMLPATGLTGAAAGGVCPVCYWGTSQGASCCERCGHSANSSAAAACRGGRAEGERLRKASCPPPEFDDWSHHLQHHLQSRTAACNTAAAACNTTAAAAERMQLESSCAGSDLIKKISGQAAATRAVCEPRNRAQAESTQAETEEPRALFDAASDMELQLAHELWSLVSQWLMHAEECSGWLAVGGQLVLAILRARSHDVQKSFKLARHFSLYREAHSWPLHMQVADCRELLRCGVCQLLPDLDDEGRAMLLIEGRRLELGQHAIEGYIKAAHLVLERAVLGNSRVQRAGVCVILDLDDTAAGDALALQSVIKTMQDTFPCKVKRIYVVNAGLMMRFTLRIVVKTLKPKLQERIVLLDKLKHLYAWIPTTKLPTKLGGLREFDWDEWINRH